MRREGKGVRERKGRMEWREKKEERIKIHQKLKLGFEMRRTIHDYVRTSPGTQHITMSTNTLIQ